MCQLKVTPHWQFRRRPMLLVQKFTLQFSRHGKTENSLMFLRSNDFFFRGEKIMKKSRNFVAKIHFALNNFAFSSFYRIHCMRLAQATHAVPNHLSSNVNFLYFFVFGLHFSCRCHAECCCCFSAWHGWNFQLWYWSMAIVKIL